jgi:hypothetical protein
MRWDPPELSHAIQVELSTLTGHPGVELADADALPPEARCEGEPDGPPAVYAVDLGARRVIGVQDCGARELAFSFVATADPLFFSFGAVRSDGSATPEGDGVLEHRSALPAGGAPVGACAFEASPRGGEGGAWLWALGAIFVVRRLRLRARRGE